MVRAPQTSPTRHVGHGLRVLYVEDDLDVQDMMRDLLETNGYDVTVEQTAAGGLEALRNDRFHLVIADYNLPDEDGATMLTRAAADGRLRCESLILTGAYNLASNATAFRIMRKPVDTQVFLAKLDDLLAPVRADEMEKVTATLQSKDGAAQRPESERVELVLYVSEASRASLRAVRRMEKLLSEFGRSREAIDFRVVDITRERPPSFDEDRIAFTPTLVKRHPEPRIYFLGTLDRVDDLVEILGQQPRDRRKATDKPA